MRKIIALICSVILVASLFVFPTFAAENPKAPDWLITEICANPEVTLADGTTNAGDIYEYIEIYNNSGKTLNLYDYCLTYNGTKPDGAGFENAITEITPLGVDWLDVGAELAADKKYTIVGNMPTKNIADADNKSLSIKAGEVVVLWAINSDAYKKDLAGLDQMLSIENFRSFWKMDAETKVVVFDANGASDKNFNIKNSDTGTYGIAKYSDDLNKIANVKDAGTCYPEGGYHESDEMVCWATVNVKSNLIGAALPNDSTAVQFAYLAACGGKMYGYAREAATPGKLNDFQKAAVNSKGLNVGTAVSTVAEFEAMGEKPGIYYLKNSIDFGGKKYDNNIMEYFSGVLDGNGYSVYNYVLDNAETNDTDSGTFRTLGKTEETVLANIFFGKADKPLSVTFKVSADSKSFGVIAGNVPKGAFSALIRNVHVFANASLNTEKKFNMGGFIGYSGKVAMIDCTMNGSLTGGNEASTTYGNVAGFVGSASNNDRCNYVRLTNNADITAVKSTNEARAAGILGYAGNTSTLLNCRNNGKVSAGSATDTPEKETSHIAGGIIASYNGGGALTVKNCVNTGVVTSKGSVGGICAVVTKGSANINGCDNYGAVTADAMKGGSIIGSVKEGLEAKTDGSNDKIGQTAPAAEPLPIPTDEKPVNPGTDPTPGTDPVKPPVTGDFEIYFVALALVAIVGCAVVIGRKKSVSDD